MSPEAVTTLKAAVRVSSYSAGLFGLVVGYWAATRFTEANVGEMAATFLVLMASTEWTVFTTSRPLTGRHAALLRKSSYAECVVGLLFGSWLAARFTEAGYIEKFLGFLSVVAATGILLKFADDAVRRSLME